MQVLILDADSLTYRHGVDWSLDKSSQHLDESIHYIVKETKSTHYIPYLTIGKTNFRYKVNPRYKANRKPTPLPHVEDLKYHILNHHGGYYLDDYEADDLCITTQKILQDRGVKNLVASIDKDLKLFGSHYNYQTGEYLEINNGGEIWLDKGKLKGFGVRFFWASMITGDTVDGIKGLKGKGPKYACGVIGNAPIGECKNLIMGEYIKHYGPIQGPVEFFNTYKLLNIVEDIPGFQLPNFIKL